MIKKIKNKTTTIPAAKTTLKTPEKHVIKVKTMIKQKQKLLRFQQNLRALTAWDKAVFLRNITGLHYTIWKKLTAKQKVKILFKRVKTESFPDIIGMPFNKWKKLVKTKKIPSSSKIANYTKVTAILRLIHKGRLVRITTTPWKKKLKL